MFVRDGDLTLIQSIMEDEWGDIAPFSSLVMDTEGLKRAKRYGYKFPLAKLMSHPDELSRVMANIEHTNVARGRGEYYLTLFEGARYSTSGDVNVPQIGNIEVKCAIGSNSFAHLLSTKVNSRSSFVGLYEDCVRVCGRGIKSFAYKELESFFRNATDTDLSGTAIAMCINKMFPLCDRVSDILLKKGFVRRLRDSKDFKNDVNEELIYPILEFNFDYYKAIDAFDCVLLMNGSHGIFIKNGRTLIQMVKKNTIAIRSSGLNLTNSRSGSIGIRLI